MAHELTFEQIQLSKQVFDRYKEPDVNNTGESKVLKANLLAILVQGLNFEMSQGELDEILVNMNVSNLIDFPTFLRIVAIKFKQEEFTKELELAFKAFDKTSKGYLTYDELKSILTEYGPKLTIEQAENLLNEMGRDAKKKFYYKEFVKDEL
jgi:calmodulin